MSATVRSTGVIDGRLICRAVCGCIPPSCYAAATSHGCHRHPCIRFRHERPSGLLLAPTGAVAAGCFQWWRAAPRTVLRSPVHLDIATKILSALGGILMQLDGVAVGIGQPGLPRAVATQRFRRTGHALGS